jgi:hypothetical protein
MVVTAYRNDAVTQKTVFMLIVFFKMVVTAYRSDAVTEKTFFVLIVFFNMEGIVHS